jgi:hypothetical protein
MSPWKTLTAPCKSRTSSVWTLLALSPVKRFGVCLFACWNCHGPLPPSNEEFCGVAFAVWLQNIAAPAQGLNVSRMRAVYGVRRYAESILAPKAALITDPVLQRANAYYFKVTRSTPLVFPLLPPHHGHDSSTHFLLFTVDGAGLSVAITVKSGSGSVPEAWREPVAVPVDTLLSGSFPQAAGTAYEIVVANAGKDAHVVVKVATQRAGAGEKK